jgi:hypothetical protein
MTSLPNTNYLSESPSEVSTAPAADPVTQEPATSDRVADSPIDSFDAYYYCVGQVYEFAAGSDEDPFELAAYADAEITDADGGYRVQLSGTADDVDSVFCVVTGTVGNPSIDDYLYPR